MISTYTYTHTVSNVSMPIRIILIIEHGQFYNHKQHLSAPSNVSDLHLVYTVLINEGKHTTDEKFCNALFFLRPQQDSIPMKTGVNFKRHFTVSMGNLISGTF